MEYQITDEQKNVSSTDHEVLAYRWGVPACHSTLPATRIRTNPKVHTNMRDSTVDADEYCVFAPCLRWIERHSACPHFSFSSDTGRHGLVNEHHLGLLVRRRASRVHIDFKSLSQTLSFEPSAGHIMHYLCDVVP